MQQKDLYTATAYEIETDYDLYHSMVAIMTQIDGVAPVGACCGRNKGEHCRKFIENRTKYLTTMEKIQERTIKPKITGKLVHVTTEQKMYNIDTCSDEQILHLIEINAVSRDYFDFSKYKGDTEKTPQIQEKHVENVGKPTAKKKKKR